MRRVDEIVNISSKSMSEKFKIWVLVNSDYVLNWMFHVKDDKKDSIDLNSIYTKEWKFSKTQIVVFDLLQQESISNDFEHIVWIDNLFTSTRFCFKIDDIEFETIDTVRITCHKRTSRHDHKSSI